jgi:hypothetical protein
MSKHEEYSVLSKQKSIGRSKGSQEFLGNRAHYPLIP